MLKVLIFDTWSLFENCELKFEHFAKHHCIYLS